MTPQEQEEAKRLLSESYDFIQDLPEEALRNEFYDEAESLMGRIRRFLKEVKENG